MGTDGLIMPTKTPKVRPENPLSDSNGGPSEVRPQMPPDSPEEVSSAPCESNFELLFSTNPVAMYVCDRETLEVLEVNPTAEQQYGYTREEFLKMKITDIRPAEDIPRLMEVARTQRATTRLPGPVAAPPEKRTGLRGGGDSPGNHFCGTDRGFGGGTGYQRAARNGGKNRGTDCLCPGAD